MPRRGALIVGIDEYPFSSMQGCVRDAKKMADILSRHDDWNETPNFECSLLVSGGGIIDTSTLTTNLVNLFHRNLEVALFYFAGHGTADNLGGYIVAQDAQKYYAGVSIPNLLALANASKAREVIIILDCGYSLDLGAPPPVDNDTVILREGVSVLAASGNTQAPSQPPRDGLFTALVCEALEGGAADLLGNVTIASVYARVEQALGEFHGRPMFQSHVCEFVPVRICRPTVELRVIRKLPLYFPDLEKDKPLDPTYVRSSGIANEQNVQVFRDLKDMRAASLLVPVDEEHMYFAAMNGKACRLTPLGKYYWAQAKKGKI
jgi:hypothetical protein